jgi:REP element-mobilizing transposase RayT
MKYNPNIRHRRSIRLKEYDYSQSGAYFVTICMHNKKCLLGKVKNGNIELSIPGQIIKKWWLELPHKFPNIKIDEYIVMPNHLHGIISIVKRNVGADLCVCPNNKGEHIGSPLQKIIQWFKTMTTNEYIRRIKREGLPPFHDKFWQRNYYEHVIRNEYKLNKIREYIQNNPLRWYLDKENPERIDKDISEDEIFKELK